MKAQLPFNLSKTEDINMSYYEDETRRQQRDNADFLLMVRNLKEFGIWGKLRDSNIRFLDVGYGTGNLLRLLSENGYGLYYGIEPLKEVYDKYRIPYAATQNIDIENYDPPVSFHFIHSFFVLEHMINPLLMFEKAYEWLVTGGRLIITCPNADCWVKGRHEIESHRWLPDRKNLIKIAQDYGFKVNKWFTYGGFSTPRGPIKSYLNKWIKRFKKGDVVCLMLEK
jgi:SAM-dependent methyltransferase